MAVLFKKSIGSPVAVDVGNQVVQGNIVSKTVQFGLFTTNENAVWASRQQLQKESYPYAFITIPVNRNIFKLQVGDVFKFSYAKYGIVGMVCRVLQITEESLKSEKITIHAMEDVFSVSSSISYDDDPTNNASSGPDYTITPFTLQTAVEAVYPLIGSEIRVMTLACIDNDLILGYDVYMSIDDGSSYNWVGRAAGMNPYGTLTENYGLTYTIDEEEGFLVDFVHGQDTLETATFVDVISGLKNSALIGGTEYISYQTVTPVTATQYLFEGIVRGRWGSQKVAHTSGESVIFTKSPTTVISPNMIKGASLKFKYVPFNSKYSGTIADATAIDLNITGVALTPFIPVNFMANDGAYDARYDDDVVLTWDCRFRGVGAGIGIPGTVLAEETHEGLFEVEVWVSSVLVRTETAIDALTWTYTEAMNLSDNTSLATSITFKLLNYIVSSGNTYESDQVEVICNLN
jgi:hypothetical protein